MAGSAESSAERPHVQQTLSSPGRFYHQGSLPILNAKRKTGTSQTLRPHDQPHVHTGKSLQRTPPIQKEPSSPFLTTFEKLSENSNSEPPDANPRNPGDSIHEGVWVVDGPHRTVWRSEGLINAGTILVANGATFIKTRDAVENNGVILVTNGASFVDRDIINAVDDDAVFIVRDASSATANRRFRAGEGAGYTAYVEVSDNSTLTARNMFIGNFGTGIMVATNSDISVSAGLTVGRQNGSLGIIELNEANLSVGGNLRIANGGDAAGVIVLQQQSRIDANSLTIAQAGSGILSVVDSVVAVTGNVKVAAGGSAIGTVVLENSTMQMAGRLDIAQQNGSIGSVTARSGSTLAATGNVRVGVRNSSTATLEIDSGSTARSGGNVLVNNNGTLTLNQGTLDAVGDLSVEGSMFTTDSTIRIGDDFSLASGSILRGGVNDIYEISGSFNNDIVAVADFDLSDVTIRFMAPGTPSDSVDVRGVDLGPDAFGYVDNYAIHGLSLASGRSLQLVDSGSSGGALYVQTLVLDDGVIQLADISGDALNIYYNPALPENAYLGGLTYPLGNGTSNLLPIGIPEPGTLFLMLLGFTCLYQRSSRKQEESTH